MQSGTCGYFNYKALSQRKHPCTISKCWNITACCKTIITLIVSSLRLSIPCTIQPDLRQLRLALYCKRTQQLDNLGCNTVLLLAIQSAENRTTNNRTEFISKQQCKKLFLGFLNEQRRKKQTQELQSLVKRPSVDFKTNYSKTKLRNLWNAAKHQKRNQYR